MIKVVNFVSSHLLRHIYKERNNSIKITRRCHVTSCRSIFARGPIHVFDSGYIYVLFVCLFKFSLSHIIIFFIKSLLLLLILLLLLLLLFFLFFRIVLVVYSFMILIGAITYN